MSKKKVVEEIEQETVKEIIEEIKELPEKIVPYMFLKIKPNDLVAKIIGINPAGADPAHPYNRYNVEIAGHKLLLKEDLVRLLFGDTGIIGTFEKSFEEARKAE